MEPLKKAAANPFIPQGQAAGDQALKAITPTLPPVPPPPSSGAAAVGPKAPDAAVAADRARINREAADKLAKRRGRQSTVVTGNEGVGYTPVGIKTLVGS